RRQPAIRAPQLHDVGAVVLNRVIVQPAQRRWAVTAGQTPGIAHREGPHLSIPVCVDVGIVLAIGEKHRGGGERRVERDQPYEELDPERPHGLPFDTFQPRPRTLRITSAPSRRRSPWMITSTALLATVSSQPYMRSSSCCRERIAPGCSRSACS